jgi:hypothetical protein
MRRVIPVFMLIVFFSGTTPAQEQSPDALWRLGLKLQPSLSWLGTSLNEFENGSSRLNFGYGLMAERALFKSTVWIASGLFVNDFGGNFNYVGQDKQVIFHQQGDSILFVSRRLRLKYVEVPLVMKFRTPEINYITYTAHFGLNLGFRTKAAGDDSFRDISAGNVTGKYDDRDIRNDISFIKAALDVGVGGEYSIAGSTSLVVNVSFLNGFTNIARKQSEMLRYRGDNTGMKQIFMSKAVVLSIGVLF